MALKKYLKDCGSFESFLPTRNEIHDKHKFYVGKIVEWGLDIQSNPRYVL